MIFSQLSSLKKMQSRLIETLEKTYTWDEICQANPDIPIYVAKWDRWLAECKETRMIEELPFTDKELEYLNSPLLDGLKELHDLDVVDAYECASTYLVITWISSTFREVERRASRVSLMNNLCREGHLETLKMFHETYPRVHLTREGFIEACRSGKYEVVKWLYETFDCSFGYWLLQAFGQACSRGELELAKMLLEVDRNRIVEYYSSWIDTGVDDTRRRIDNFVSIIRDRKIVDWLQELFDIDEKFRV